MATRRAAPSPKFGQLKANVVGPKTQYLVLYNLLSLVLWLGILLRLVATYLLTQSTSGQTLINRNAILPTTPSRSPFLDIVYPATARVLKWTQTLALVEILHAATGLVRTSVVTTGMQVASRLLLVWGIVHLFGEGLLVTGSAGLMQKGLDWGLGGIPGLEKAVELGARARNMVGGFGLGSGLLEVERNQIAYAGMLLAWSVTECIRYLYFVFFIGSETGHVSGFLVWLR